MAIIKSGLYQLNELLDLTQEFTQQISFKLVWPQGYDGEDMVYICDTLSVVNGLLYANITAVTPEVSVSGVQFPVNEPITESDGSIYMEFLRNIYVLEDTEVSDTFNTWISTNAECKSVIRKGTYRFNDIIERPPVDYLYVDFTTPDITVSGSTFQFAWTQLTIIDDNVSEYGDWVGIYTGTATNGQDSEAIELPVYAHPGNWNLAHDVMDAAVPEGYGQIVTFAEDIYIALGYENLVEWFYTNASSYDVAWLDQAYRNIEITGGADAQSETLEAFLKLNAAAVSGKVTVTWKNYNGDILQEDLITVGETPVYNGNTPVKEGTPHYTYTFKGWNPEVGPVTEATVYVAQFEAVVNKYIVKWLNADGTELLSEQVEYGVVPSYDGTPAKPMTDAEIFTFAGWTPAISAVTQGVTYTATYTSEPRYYTVLWQNEDYNTLLSQQIAYGEVPSYPNAPPTKADTEDSYFTFDGWSPAISAVVGDVVYTAVFKEHILISYAINLQLIYIDASADSDSVIKASRTAKVKLSAKSGFTLPSEITVTGADYSYDIITGEINLSNPTSDVTIAARAIRVIDSNILIGKLGKIGAAYFNGKKVDSIWLGNIQVYGLSNAVEGSVVIEANEAGGLTYIIVSDEYTITPNDAGGNTYDITVDGADLGNDVYYAEEPNSLGTTVIFDTYEEEPNDLGTTVIIHTEGSGEYYAEEPNSLGTTVIFGTYSDEQNDLGTTVNINH